MFIGTLIYLLVQKFPMIYFKMIHMKILLNSNCIDFEFKIKYYIVAGYI